MKLLIADFDGVLNNHQLDLDVMCGDIDPSKVRLLNKVLKETGAFLVVSSAWRYLVHRGEMNLQGFDWLLRSHGILANRFIGITRRDHHRVTEHWDGRIESWIPDDERGQQIADFLTGNGHYNELGIERCFPFRPTDTYAVIDDMDLGISAAGHPFVKTDGTHGMAFDDAKTLIALLNNPEKTRGEEETRTQGTEQTQGSPPPKVPAPRPLRLEYRKPSELAENPANWRTHPDTQLLALGDVISEVGWAGAVLFNEATGRLIDGHARQKFAVAADEPIPVLIGSWTEAQERLILATLIIMGVQAFIK